MSGVCNILASIKTARHYGFGAGDRVFTVATDGFDRYPSVLRRLDSNCGPMSPDVATRRISLFHERDDSWVLDGSEEVQLRWHNQKYFTWVEQQGKGIEELNALWAPDFWAEQAQLAHDFDRQTLATRGGG